MSNTTHALGRIASYGKNIQASKLLADCIEIISTGLQSCRADIEAVLATPTKADGIRSNAEKSANNLAGTKDSLRTKQHIDVAPIDEEERQKLVEAYRTMLQEAVKGKKAPKDLRVVLSRIATASLENRILAERLAPSLARAVEILDGNTADEEGPVILEFNEGVDFVEAGEDDETLTDFTADDADLQKKAN